jgi:hypothetical protein
LKLVIEVFMIRKPSITSIEMFISIFKDIQYHGISITYYLIVLIGSSSFIACEDASTSSNATAQAGSMAGQSNAGQSNAGQSNAGQSNAGQSNAGQMAGENMAGEMGAQVDYSSIRINEINAKGDPSDWIEIYNTGLEAIDLSLCLLSDNSEVLDKAIIPSDPSMIIPAQGFALFLLGEPPFDFKLGSAEEIFLSTPNGEEIDRLTYADGDAPQGSSYGRLPDGAESIQTLYMPTPMAPNMQGNAPECGDGVCSEGENCTIDCQVCGDGQCDTDESCPIDCSICGDGQCDIDEDCDLDCTPVSCGDDLCSPNEECPADCTSEGVLVINEIAAAGDPEDWAELYYLGEGQLDLGTFFLSDDLSEPQKASLQGLSIESGAFLWIEISDATLGFKLAKDEALYLSNQAGVLVDFVDWDEFDSPVDQSYARQPNGSGNFETSSATPGESNE